MKNTTADATLDIRNVIAPVALLKVEGKLSHMQCGQILEVLCTDSETKTDLCTIAKNAGHGCKTFKSPSSTFRLLIEKGLYRQSDTWNVPKGGCGMP